MKLEEGFEKTTTDREEIFSKAVRAGKRTYFFDVKVTKGNDFYLTITESKKRFAEDGKFTYEIKGEPDDEFLLAFAAFRPEQMKKMKEAFSGLNKTRSTYTIKNWGGHALDNLEKT